MRLHIFGASGSGVTTLGHELSQQLELRYFDTDSYHWVPVYPPFSVRRPKSERHEWLVSDLSKQRAWILGGTVYNWGEYWRTAFDLAVYLWLPGPLRMHRLHQREEARQLSTVLNQNHSKEFLDWAAHYDQNDLPGRSRQLHEQWIQQLTCPILRLEGDLTTEERVQLVLAQIDILTAT